MKVHSIGNAEIEGQRYLIIYTDDGGAKLQRAEQRSLSDQALWPHEELIIALCEKLRPGCSEMGKEVKP